MSLRRLQGWEPRELHVPHYAPATWWKPWTWWRLESIEVVREAEYSPTDRALLIAHQRNRAEIGPHGIPMSEATDSSNQFAYEKPTAPLVDWAAKAIGDGQDVYYAANPKVSRHGHIWRLKRPHR